MNSKRNDTDHLKPWIEKRKSTRAFLPQALNQVTLDGILEYSRGLHRLDPTIETRLEIVEREAVKLVMPWTAPHWGLIYASDHPWAELEVGFRYQQLDLYIQSLGLGVCWVGLGRPKTKLPAATGLNFVIMLGFGQLRGSGYRSGQFRRKNLSEICHPPDTRLEPARLAPSSSNSQPWYFQVSGDYIHCFGRSGDWRSKLLGRAWMPIDLGIALAHLAISWDEFDFERLDSPPQHPSYEYIGSLRQTANR